MGNVYTVTEVLHRIKAKLYPNYLQNVKGAYIARTANEAVLSIEDVCASMKNRGGYQGDYHGAVDAIRHFNIEAAYKLGDGYAVDLGLCSIHPNIGGTFNTAKDTYDPEKHEVDFRYRTGSMLRELAQTIAVDIEGVADTQGYIAEFTDVKSKAINQTFTPGGMFVLTGYKIKAVGEDESVGVYFLQETTGTVIKTEENLAENSASKVIGIIPPEVKEGSWKVRIVTQFSSGATLTKRIRQIESGFTLTGCNGNSATETQTIPTETGSDSVTELQAIPAVTASDSCTEPETIPAGTGVGSSTESEAVLIRNQRRV